MDKGTQIANKRLSLRLIIFWRWINLRAKSTSWNLLKELMEQSKVCCWCSFKEINALNISLLTVTSTTTFLALIPQGEFLTELLPYSLFPTLSGRCKGRTVVPTVFAGYCMLIKKICYLKSCINHAFMVSISVKLENARKINLRRRFFYLSHHMLF